MYDYKIILCDSERSYLKETKYKKLGGGACIKWNKIIMLTHLKEKRAFSYNFTLFHELNHLFYKRLVGHMSPIWLAEGLALLRQRDYVPKKLEINNLKERNLSRFLVTKSRFKTLEDRIKFYAISYLSVRDLEKKEGMSRLIDFLYQIPKPYSDKRFWEIFEYNFKLTKKGLVERIIFKAGR